MIKKPIVQFVALVVFAVFVAGTWASGDGFKFGWLRFYSLAVFISYLGLVAWDNFIWRLPWTQKIKSVPRNLRGTWRGTLDSFWVDPKTGLSPDKKTVYLIIRQSATSISVVLLTDESRSVSSVGEVTDDHTVASLDYMYLNRPDSRVEHRSRMHHGSTSLDIIGRPATRLEGRYWTDRDTKGELEFVERRHQMVEGYQEAEAIFD